MHRSHGLQGSLKRRYKHPSPTSINGYHTAKKLLSQSPAKRPTFAFTSESEYTLGFLRKIAHNGTHAETGVFRMGDAITTLGTFRTFTNIPGPGVRTANFAAFGSWSEALLKDTESLRNSDALMRVAVPQASRPRWAARSGEYAMDYVVSICTLDDNNNRLCRRSRNSCFCACGGGQIQHHN